MTPEDAARPQSQPSDDANGASQSGGQPVPEMAILTQYIADLSFENPNPTALSGARVQPKFDIGIDVQAETLGGDRYLSVLKMRTSAVVDEKVLFLVELDYAGIFGIRGFPAEAMEPLLLVECPRLLFPFARRVIADVTRDGGYPPVLLEPIDFIRLYQQKRARDRGQGQAADSALASA